MLDAVNGGSLVDFVAKLIFDTGDPNFQEDAAGPAAQARRQLYLEEKNRQLIEARKC